MKWLNYLALIIFSVSFVITANAQTSGKLYSEMSETEKIEFVGDKLDEITVKISGNKYKFDSNFKLGVTKFLDSYQKRTGNKTNKGSFGDDLNFVLQRGSEFAPSINKAFDKIGVSRLSGLYIAMIESEFNPNITSPTGSKGLFQIDLPRAYKYGLAIKARTDVEKSADMAARYLQTNQMYFADNKMKEFLAILSWNREPKKIKFDINFKFMSDSPNIACAICGLTANPNRFDQQFQTESVKYVPKFLAAAIIGENPQVFGLTTKPLSSF
ncbi:MAG: transglycosylase SLT domain-containing protein [Pyrinomonadaceae bacterium]|nr:transglycosylase SLT domain-containing protein [Pyrinomonadaceae bacterium]